ncbi:MAG: ComEC/Rec2 family competence protein [Fimbriimonas sp.]
MSVGQGDCTLLRTGNANVLVDVGPSSEKFDAGERMVLPELRRRGVDHIDAILLTHPDLDHVGGLGAVRRRFPNAKIWTSAEFENDKKLADILIQAKVDKGDIVWLPERGEIDFGSWQATFWCPPVEAGTTNDNLGSVMMRVTTPAGAVVLTGDAPEDVERRALATGLPWEGDVLKAGHHGSATSSCATWLGAVGPTWVVFSAGRGNRYGHPSQKTLKRVEELGAKSIRTDQSGTIQFKIGGQNLNQ